MDHGETTPSRPFWMFCCDTPLPESDIYPPTTNYTHLTHPHPDSIVKRNDPSS